MSVSLNKAKQELDEFLAENPELVSYQMRLNEYMSVGKNSQERMQILARHMTDNLIQLQVELFMLKTKLEEIV
jgi:predicted nuclease with TOPRIM domain